MWYTLHMVDNELSLEDQKQLATLYLNLWKSAEAEVVRLEAEKEYLQNFIANYVEVVEDE